NLVQKNADLDARDESGWLPVHWAAQSGSVETLCNLHYLGADFVSRTYVGETALHIAAQYNDGAMLQALLASNADIEELNFDMRTALHMAAVNGQTEALQTLLFYKADLEKTVEDDSGMTAFLLAVTHEREGAVHCMLSDIPFPPKLPISLPGKKKADAKK
ncbi:Ankyrin repeat domain-containing protein 42, partial [Durusdinium trenchii]